MKKIMIASDIHGSAYYCRKLLERYEAEKPDRLVLLGDILYHGPVSYTHLTLPTKLEV